MLDGVQIVLFPIAVRLKGETKIPGHALSPFDLSTITSFPLRKDS